MKFLVKDSVGSYAENENASIPASSKSSINDEMIQNIVHSKESENAVSLAGIQTLLQQKFSCHQSITTAQFKHMNCAVFMSRHAN